MLTQQQRGLIATDAVVAGDQRHGCHHVTDEGRSPLRDRHKTKIAVGNNA